MENKLYRILFFTSVILIILSFNLQHNPPSGWQKQMLPDSLPNFQVSDMFFLDSLTGWIVTGNDMPNDLSGYIIKTTNGGNNWELKYSDFRDYSRVIFLNNNTGYVCGGYNTGARLLKSTNGGDNWFSINGPAGQIFYDDMNVLSEDTIWIAIHEASTGGIYLTTNGGQNWTRKYYAGGFANPDKIYFVNNQLGFASKGILLRTSDGGNTWNNMQPELRFNDIFFSDSLIGYMASMGEIRKTVNAGLNWISLNLPLKNDTISSNDVEKISKMFDGSMYAVGPEAFIGSLRRKGLVFKTKDEGTTWGYQLPDTNIFKFQHYSFVDFIDKNTGWVYQGVTGGIFTNVGGDSTIYVNIKNISTEMALNFKLYQNYPNPFNPTTKIRYDLLRRTTVNLKIFDINGKEVMELVNKEHLPGTYEVEFDGSSLSSGIYFGVLATDNFKDVIRMILIK